MKNRLAEGRPGLAEVEVEIPTEVQIELRHPCQDTLHTGLERSHLLELVTEHQDGQVRREEDQSTQQINPCTVLPQGQVSLQGLQVRGRDGEL